MTLASDNNIPINKRGSGVRRLIVLNFFRAEAERRRNENNSQAIIYAFEEPENSQHPNHQEMLIKAFQELAETDKTQVCITTHNPALAGLVKEKDLFFVTTDPVTGDISVRTGEADILRSIAKTLGMLPDPTVPVLLICVEGPNDIAFLKNISAIISQHRNDLPNLATSTKVAIFPLGGGTLKDWVTHDYLNGLNIPQYHLYDLDDAANPPYLPQRDAVRARGGRNWADLTAKRETENYLHHDCISAVIGHVVPPFGDMDDVPEIVASIIHNASGGPNPWHVLDDKKKKQKMSNAKRRLNYDVAQQMTYIQIQQADAAGDIVGWLEAIRDRLN